MDNKKLFIHIGSHKTGTTSIQYALTRSKAILKAHGLTLFDEHYNNPQQHTPHVHSWLSFINENSLVPRGMQVTEPAALAKQLSQIEGNVIISSENFSFFFEQAAINKLKESLEKFFTEIHIICYLRRQDRHIISHHQEGSKLYRKAENNLFGHSTRAIPDNYPFHTLYLDYARRLDLWANAFGQDNLSLRIFDRKLLLGGDVVHDFFWQLGISHQMAATEENTSLGFRDIKLGHLINGTRSLRHKSVLSSICQASPGDTRKMLPSRSEAMRYYAQFRESNAALNARFAISANPDLFDDDFSDYPEVAQDRWTEASANAAVIDILQFIDNNYAQLDAYELRDAAVAIGDSNPAIAIKLLRIALFLRPEGHWIRHLLEEFEQASKST